jgi:outer membrane protein assembly factor BamA
MTKLVRPLLFLLILLSCLQVKGQASYPLQLRAVDKDSIFLTSTLALRTSFDTRAECIAYVNELSPLLQMKGYVTASIDSIFFDSAAARAVLYIGDRYEWGKLDASQVDPAILFAIGWREKAFIDKPMDFAQVQSWQEKIITHLENNGRPFGKVYIDSFRLEQEKVWASLKVEPGPAYRIDSIRVVGDAKISSEFLQRFLDIRNGSTFDKQKLLNVSRKMRELSYVEEERPSRLIWLNSGSFLEMYLKQKQSSQVNVLVGFLPNNDQLSSKKLLVTGEANLLLRNALGSGETIGLNWQQLQVRSPRLNIIYRHPYLFNTPVGLDFSFDMFRKDSSFLNVNFQLGAQYVLDSRQSGKLFIQRFQSIVTSANTNYILQTYQLPEDADVSSTNVGIDYEFNNTNYRMNPTRGNEFRIITSAGTKKVKRNNEVLELKDPGNPAFDFNSLYDTLKLSTYQFRTRVIAAKYLPIGRQSTFKLGLNGGFFQSGNIFRNELFQIGGYKLLRGFDEESQYLSQFAIGTLEYRYLIGQNSFFYGFLDGGWGRNNSQNNDVDYSYFGTGLGLAFETKLGIFNLAWAIGRRSDVPFSLRQSKVHFGFVNFF